MRLIARFAKEQEKYFEVITVYDLKVVKERINKKIPILLSIAKEYPSAVWFERKMLDDFGIKILYGTNKPSLVYHKQMVAETYPMRKGYRKKHLLYEKPLLFSALNTSLSLGPTQAYHLESSQFRFIEKNNTMTQFNTKNFYKHRGIEKMLEGLTLEEARPIVERISGSMSMAYQLAYLDIELQASKKELPMIIKKRHLFFLELERILNHLFDMSLICQFVEFKEGAFFLMKLHEEGRELLKKLTGHRYGFSTITIDGSLLSVEESDEYLFYLEQELLWFEKWISKEDYFWKKLLNQGVLLKKDIEAYGLVGLMARSVDIDLDRRQNDKLYMEYDFCRASEYTGDVSARFKIRLTEIFTSLSLIKPLIKNRVFPFFIGSIIDGEYYSYIESSSGELMMYISIKNQKIERFFLRDPSFLNAQILPHVMNGNLITSLGLISKSIPLSFSASDL